MDSLEVLFSPSPFGSSHSGDHNFLFLVPVLQARGLCFSPEVSASCRKAQAIPCQFLHYKKSHKASHLPCAAAPPQAQSHGSLLPTTPAALICIVHRFLCCFLSGCVAGSFKTFPGSKANNCLSRFRTALGMTPHIL